MTQMDQHPTLDELVDYEAGELREQGSSIRSHLESCPECQLLAREIRGASEAWHSWSVRTHFEAYQASQNARMSEALEQLEAKAPENIRVRLKRWKDKWAGRAGGVVRVMMGKTVEASRVLAEGLEALRVSGAGAALQVQAAPTRGPMVRPVGGAVRTSGGLSMRQARQQPSRLAIAPGIPAARVEVTGEGEVTVQVDDLPPGPTPLVLLASLDEGVLPRLAALEKRGDPPALVARFDAVETGEYVVALEPADTISGPP